jgi:hypothetical protein
MYGQDIQPIAAKPRRSYRTLVVILLIAGALITLFSWGASRRTKTYHRVGAYPLHADQLGADDMLLGYGIMPCLTGFCVREDAFVFTLRDWETGKQRWQVSTAIPYADPKKAKFTWLSEFHAAVSPDGSRFVAASSDDNNLRVQSWEDGKLLGEVAIPLLPLIPFQKEHWVSGKQGEVLLLRSTVTDDGRCFVSFTWKYTVESLQAFVIEGDRVVARYAGNGTLYQFSPDGTAALLSSRKLARVVIEGNTLRFTDQMKLPSQGIQLGAAGAAVTEDGAIYRLSGKPVAAKGFTCDTVTTSGRYAILYNEKVTRAVDLQTGDSWEIEAPGVNHGGDATEDGQHILASFATRPGGLTGLLRNAVGMENHFIVLYQRPGRQRAWMRIDRLQPMSWWPSPDGRAVAFTTENECLLYRW